MAPSMAACAFENFDEAIKDVDVVMMLRLQRERMEEGLGSLFGWLFSGLRTDAKRLLSAKQDAIVMHPGPDESRC